MSIGRIYLYGFIFIILSLSSYAQDVSGVLSAGEGSLFKPVQGSAFSIKSDIESGIYDGSFDVSIKCGGEVIYDQKDQTDDLYLVFNDYMQSEDFIKIDVKKGVFKFNMTHMEDLPDAIVGAIQEQAPEVYEELTPLHDKQKKHKHKKAKTKKTKKSEPLYEEKMPTQHNEETLTQSPRVLKREVDPKEYKKEVEVEKSKTLPHFETKIDDIANQHLSVTRFRTKVLEDSSIANQIDSISQSCKTKIPKFTKNSKIVYDHNQDIEERVSKPSLSSGNLKVTSDLKRNDITLNSPKDFNQNTPKFSTKTPTFTKNKIPVSNDLKENKFENNIVNHVEKPKFSNNSGLIEIKEIKPDKKFSSNIPSSNRLIKVNKIKPQESIPTFNKPSIDSSNIIASEEISKPKEIKREKFDKKVEKFSESKPNNKIVITKVLKKKRDDNLDNPRVIRREVSPSEYKRSHQKTATFDKMSDRVIGGGVADTPTSSIKVRAFSNKRAISAWVEVFTANTHKRVTTFYTGRSSKKVKLPAGVYIIKATYRTSRFKRKKVIGKIRLNEGDSITKNIVFNNGSLAVVAKKSGKPLYAKVEIYKAGSKRRIDYDFTSTKNGVVNFSLGSGNYDVVVRDHADVKRFNNIKIRGSRSKTLDANF